MVRAPNKIYKNWLISELHIQNRTKMRTNNRTAQVSMKAMLGGRIEVHDIIFILIQIENDLSTPVAE